ncbi:MAG: NAD-dependent epimerase/dehydratase [Frankiales bacterium]|nr:NAD-dependent epimerase/dehydratase [Frankiales bacterium]
MRVLVTGVAGFIGSHLTDRLLAEGHEVVGLDDLSAGALVNLTEARRAKEFRFSRFDVADPALSDLVAHERPEVVCHLAAQMDVRKSVADPTYDARVNVLGTVNVLEASRRAGVRKVVFASSGGTIYGQPAKLPVGERAGLMPCSPYGAAKAAAETYLATYGRLYGLDWTSLALGNVYGPRQDPHGEAGVVAIFARALLAGRPTLVFGDGTAERDYVYVDDVVDAFVRALGEAGRCRRLNVGTGVGTTVRGLHTLLAEAVGTPDTPEFRPARRGELQAITLENGGIRRALGWEPFTSLSDGLRSTVDWVRGTVGPVGPFADSKKPPTRMGGGSSNQRV